ncbi:MAG: radical SAM family heme chaperone HemW [Myxococcota bacterium]|nr:radical SAM family heme chaperone HemW [Myxococcota bacterium]
MPRLPPLAPPDVPQTDHPMRAAVNQPPGFVGEKAPTAGVYVHFPWCLAKCPYCDFVSYATPRENIDHGAYADAVLRELSARTALCDGRRMETVFFGGGTPSLWEARSIARVIRQIRIQLACSEELEITVECNPTSLDEQTARALVDAGVNRVSIGVQSLDDARLRTLGRLHDAAGGRRAVRDALRAGVPRVSGDLIFGLPGQTPETARDEALALVDLGVRHLSCYQLTIEPRTRFGELARRGRLPLADEGAVAESFLAIDEALGLRGFRHYEVSNYAQSGEEARHNLGYWRGDEYLGLGCAAVGFARIDEKGGEARGIRWRNAAEPETYVDATRSAREDSAAASCGHPTAESMEPLDAQTLLRERIMLGLRVDEGFDLEAAARSLCVPGWTPGRTRAAAWLEERHRIVREGGRVRVPRAAWLWTDDTSARLF